jgi:nitroreductase
MNFSDLIATRFSVRDYKQTPVEEEKLTQILNAARLAPSACNLQPYYFIVMIDPAKKELLRTAYNRDWFVSAPVIIAACVDTRTEWKRSDGVAYGVVDIAIALDHMTLAAAELGLGTCWIGAFKNAEASAALKLPGYIKITAFLALGYANQTQPPKQRKPLEAIICREQFAEAR